MTVYRKEEMGIMKKFLSVIISIAMILGCASLAGAASFPDVLSPDHDWAATQISEMTSLGIIKGYTDGTFKPDKSISKIEALLLFARVAGYTDKNNEKLIAYAYDKYGAMLGDLDLGGYNDYKKEIAFLLYKGIVSDANIEDYLGGGEYSNEFPRVDAAMLLSNLMDAQIKEASASSLDFADAASIPYSSLGYVKYVVEEGLMNGVAKDDGTVVFDADKPLSRAQVCVLLYRIIDKLNISAEAGVCTKADKETGTIEFTSADGESKSYIISDSVKININASAGKLEDIYEKSDIVVVRHGKNIYSLEVLSPASNLSVKGNVVAAVSSKAYSKISIKEEATGKTQTYYSNKAVKVTTDGVSDSFDSIKTNDYVVIELLGSDIVSIDRQTSEATVQGVVKSISLNTPIKLTVTTKDETTRKETDAVYTVSDSATIRRDGSAVSLREILTGDKVVLTITRGDISKIIATSVSGSVSGTVKSLTIASQSSITITSGGVDTTYDIKLDASFVVGGKEGSIYDLRLGNVVSLTLSGNTATKVEQTSSSAATTKSGVVDTVSTAYGYINIISGSTTEQIFGDKAGSTLNVKIINGETGKELYFKDIKKGDYIIATGAYSNGAFVAKTIVVTPSEAEK